ncbi:MAG: 5'/3'-nucleotidase SurE [Deltaproteobacteria bacterium]|nr:5'/3'-nucleotidase SurE [Candidatus Zymogenaceae bacterium]
MIILISNDDGIDAAGIGALAARLERDHTVFVVAPAREQSASSHSLTLRRPLSVRKIKERYYSVDGTPADCVNLAVNSILDVCPDLVVSGINHGANLGDDVFYSGTVSAAIEGMLLNIPSIAVSYEMKEGSDFGPGAQFAADLVGYLAANPMPNDTVLSVNVPDRITDDHPPYRITKQGKRIYSSAIVRPVDPPESGSYMIGPGEIGFEDDIESDFFAMTHGYISITPLHLDMTNYISIGEIKQWKIRTALK